MLRLKVRDLMTADVFTLKADDTLATLYDLMDARRVRHVPIVNDEGDLVGLVSQRDLLKGAMGDTDDLPINVAQDALSSIRVGQLMTIDPETAEADEDLSSAGQTLIEYKFGCLPVVEGTQLIGILTESDFVRHVVSAQSGVEK